ncbi:hypothetical protein N7507_000396 [Penicillium longicatenatum]|nr:hypothetical protein N7507_000396 [Penicillium longicatenatum]
MPQFLKTLLNSLKGQRKISKAQEQKDCMTNDRPSKILTNKTNDIIEADKSSETLHPRDLWQAAYDQLDDKQRQGLLNIQISSESKDKKANWRDVIHDITQVTEQRYEAYKHESDGTIRRISRRIIDAVLSYEEIISAVAGLDPTQHAASAWAVVSLVLKIPENHRDARNALFESSEYLADVITQCAFIEHQKFDFDSDSKIRGHVESALIKVYKAILCYSGYVHEAQEPGLGRTLSDCFTAISGHPFEELKDCVEKQRESLLGWIQLDGYLCKAKEAERIILKIDEINESLKLLLEQNSLMHLKVVEGALYDSHVHEHEDFCLPGTRTELLSRIMDWATSDDKLIFWLNGMAGTGKSTIARTVAQDFNQGGLLGATFFIKRGEIDRGNARFLITSIAGQLVTRHRELVPGVLHAIKTDPRITTRFLRDQFDQLLYRPLINLQPKQSTAVVIIIDALDECSKVEDIKLILHLLFKLQEVKSIRIRVVLTSRPELPIRIGFDEEENHQDLILHGIPAPMIENDIRQFLKHKLTIVQKNRSLSSDWPGHENIEKLVKMAVPLFIFASTACLSIGNAVHPQKQLQNYLDFGSTNASQLKKTYLPALQQLLGGDEEESGDILEEFRDTVGVIILLKTPLSVDSLALLLQKPAPDISDLLESLHSVLNVPINTSTSVRSLHLSFRDFLVGTDCEFRVDEKATHRKIALHCLRIMDTRLKKNICDLANYGIQRQDIDPQIIKHHLPADFQYCCYYWVHHLKQSRGGMSGPEILVFLRKRFLHWLEAIALIGKLSEARELIETLESRTWERGDLALSEFLNDAKRFVLQNAYVTGIAPLQLYSSGIAFAPAQSVIKRTFLSEISERIRTLPEVVDSWSTNLQTLEGHSGRVFSVTFSRDGLTLASGSEDGTVKTWEAATGIERQTLAGHSDSVTSVTISPDGQILASSPEDKTIKLWDMATGTEQQTLEGDSESSISVAFSPDGLTLASGSRDCTVKLWDMVKLKQRQTLEGHSGWLFSVAFSPDGFALASGSSDGTVRIWDTATGTVTQQLMLERHSGGAHSVAFSPDGLTLATGLIDDTIRLWDLATGTQRQMLEGHSGWVDSLAFSPDGLTLASGSKDWTIKIWEMATGTVTHQHLLKGQEHSSRVNSLALSPNGLTLASGSSDCTVKFWDTKTSTATLLQTLEGHSDWVTSVAFSHNGLNLASGSTDSTIRLWDTVIGTQRQTLEGHSDSVVSVAFSPNGLDLVSCSGDGTIKLWDLATGMQRETRHGYPDPITSKAASMAFNLDGLMPALKNAPTDSQIYLWKNWFCLGCENLLWLPVEHRSFTCLAAKDATIALGYEDGRVLVFGFHAHTV